MSLAGSQLIPSSRNLEKGSNGIVNAVEVYEGSRDAIYGKANQLYADQQWRIDDSDKPVYRLTIRTPDWNDGSQSQATWHWELPGETITKDIREHPYFASVSDAHLTIIEKQLADRDAAFSATTALTSTISRELYAFLSRKVETYFVSQYSIRLTQIVGSLYVQQLADVDVNKRWTTTQLGNAAAANGTPIPGRLEWKIVNGITAPTIPSGYQWSWLKRASSELQNANGTISISTEWLLDAWNTTLYGPSTY